ncbi:MAG: hypothetical protein J0I12_08885 [Candidatus Eremiobacteraeota bacterium]|nr:hypothetical protein [Candidatus Eremiobacteraeota bacterium]
MDNNQMHQNGATATTIYPHPAIVQRVIPFNSDPNIQSKVVAAVQLRYGPIQINGKLVHGDKGLFLSMPARKSESDGEYYDHASVLDASLMDSFRSLAIAEYVRMTGVVLAA